MQIQRRCDSAELFRIGDRVDAVDAALLSLKHDDDEGPPFRGEYDRWGTVQLGLVQERIGRQSLRDCDNKAGHSPRTYDRFLQAQSLAAAVSPQHDAFRQQVDKGCQVVSSGCGLKAIENGVVAVAIDRKAGALI